MAVQNNNYITIDTPSFNLAAHEEIFIKILYSSSVCAPQETSVMCTLNAITKMDQWIGDSFQQKFIIQAKTVYSQLCVSISIEYIYYILLSDLLSKTPLVFWNVSLRKFFMP